MKRKPNKYGVYVRFGDKIIYKGESGKNANALIVTNYDSGVSCKGRISYFWSLEEVFNAPKEQFHLHFHLMKCSLRPEGVEGLEMPYFDFSICYRAGRDKPNAKKRRLI